MQPMKSTTLFIFFFLLSFHSFSQAVETQIFSIKKIKWDEDDNIFYEGPEKMIVPSTQATISLSYDKIKIFMEEPTNLFLNETPIEKEDSVSVQRIWYKVVDASGSPMFTMLFYFKDDDYYKLRVLNQKTHKGIDFYSKAVKNTNSKLN